LGIKPPHPNAGWFGSSSEIGFSYFFDFFASRISTTKEIWSANSFLPGLVI